MNPRDYFKNLPVEDKQAFAARCGCSLSHLQLAVLGTKIRKRPRDLLIVNIVKASEGHISLDEAIDYFLVQPVKKLAESQDSIHNKTKAAARKMHDSRRVTPQPEPCSAPDSF